MSDREHSCNENPDPLAYMKQFIGKQDRVIIELGGIAMVL